MAYTYKGKPVELIAETYTWHGQQYCTIMMTNRLGRSQRQSVQLRHLMSDSVPASPICQVERTDPEQPTQLRLEI